MIKLGMKKKEIKLDKKEDILGHLLSSLMKTKKILILHLSKFLIKTIFLKINIYSQI